MARPERREVPGSGSSVRVRLATARRAATAFGLLLLAGSVCHGDAPSEALEAFRRKAQLSLGEAAFAGHDVDTAQRRLEGALQLARKADDAPELARVLELLGDVYRRRNQLSGARSFYMRALQRAPAGDAKPPVLEKLGLLALQRGRWSEATDWFEQALEIQPEAKRYLRLGEAELQDGREEQAAAAFEKAVASTEGAARVAMHESISRRYRWQGRDAEAAKAHDDRALELRRAWPESLSRALRSRALLAVDDAAAEQYLAELAELPGESAAAEQIRSRRAAAGNLDAAIREQAAAIELLRQSGGPPKALASALEALAKLEERRDNDAAAAGLRREALALRSPETPAALAAVAALAANLVRSGEVPAAEELWLTHAATIEGAAGREALPLASASEGYGDYLLSLDRFQEAVDQYRKAVRIRRLKWGVRDGGLQRGLEKLADALRREGREEEARRAESQLAALSFGGAATREPPRGPRDTGTWLSDPGGLAFVGLALCAASFGVVWLGWTTFTRMQPELEAGFRPRPAAIAEAPGWKPVVRPQARYPVAFRGRGGALFGIWSVNIALTLATLGLYFFWGKVRIRRYFWGQAEVAGDRFAFHGTGRELLLGWLKAAPVLALVLWGPGLLDLAWNEPNAGLYGAGVALCVLGVLWPLAEVGASRYRLSRTSWRAVRFSFKGAAWPYMKLWLGGMILWILTLGLWAPFFHTARRRYMVDNMRFGDARFECDISGKDLFSYYLVSWVLFLPTAGASYFWYKALAERYYWSRTQLIHNEEDARATFECTLKGIDLVVLWIQTMATLTLTLGLAWPWTRIWEARLRLQTLAVTGDFRPGRIRQSTDAAGAAGEGAADFLGLDFGFFA